MKKVIFTLLSFCLLYMNSNAQNHQQYCGGSGPSVCTPSGTLTQPGLSPASDSLPPVVNGVQNSTIIQFKNFDTIAFGGQVLTIHSLKVDTIGNLPTGLCWATNKTDNTFQNKEDGCIKVTGTPCADPGQYKLFIWVDANVGLITISTNAQAANLKYFVRCINNGSPTPSVDTSATADFVSYGYAKNCVTGINSVDGDFSSLSIVPNPFNGKALVNFNSDKAGVVTERLTNMIGSVISETKIDVHTGSNVSSIERNNLPAGVYFYTITDGSSAITKRVVISE